MQCGLERTGIVTVLVINIKAAVKVHGQLFIGKAFFIWLENRLGL